MRRSAAALAAAALLLLRPASSSAHAVGVSRGDYRAESDAVRVELVFARSEVETMRPRSAIAEWIRHGLVIGTPAGACDGVVERTSATEQDGLAIVAVYRCPAPVRSFSVQFALLDGLSFGHRHLVSASTPTANARAVLYETQPAVTVGAANERGAPRRDVAAALVRLGVAHILTGYDHLLFLLALVLAGGGLRAMLGMVTAFTVAHSLTLAVAVSRLWTPPSTVVEPAIALSIAYVGIENCIGTDVRRRWRLTFLFGLVHGFGFAGALQEVAVSAEQLPLALASFNLGVEAGQLAALAVVLPCVTALGRSAWFRRGGLQLASVAITAIGLAWFAARLAGR